MHQGQQRHPQDMFLIPELIEGVGSHLTPPDLLSCVQVNQLWNTHLLPLLWDSIDDSLYSWPTILKQRDTVESGEWLKALFTKHGHLIRHLIIHWIPTLDAIGKANTSTRLHSLLVRELKCNMTSEEEEAHKAQARLWDYLKKNRVKDERSRPLPDEFLVSPAMGQALRPGTAWWTTDKKYRQDWMTGQRFWVLVQQNPNLCELGMGRCLELFCRIQSEDFFHDTMAGLRRLTTLENNFYDERLQGLLSRNPSLATFRCSFAFSNSTLSTTFLSMRSLVTGSGFTFRNFFLILHHLPNLEDLDCGGIGLFDRELCPNGGEILEGRPSKLRRLMFYQQARTDAPMANLVLPWLPSLQEITSRCLFFPETARALATHCRDLEVLRQEDNTKPIHCFQDQDEQRNFMLPVLQECPKLRVFDAIHHRIDADLLFEKPFACARLNTFRCQVVGVKRLSAEEGTAGCELIVEGTLTSRERGEALQEQQRSVFDQFARLKQLSTLDLGYAWRNSSRMESTLPSYRAEDGEEYIDYGEPIPQTLELTLESGLDRLSSLQNLEVFGFEGVDFKLGRPELEWMAVNWPRLKVLRGLQRDVSLARLGPEKHKQELREYM